MDWEHVVPQFAVRLELAEQVPSGEIAFPIQGSGQETRSFCYIDDFIDGLLLVQDKGANKTLYHIGTTEEVTIANVAALLDTDSSHDESRPRRQRTAIAGLRRSDTGSVAGSRFEDHLYFDSRMRS